MKQFEEVKRFSHPELEEEILAWWEANDTFARSMDQRAGAPTYTFYEGPPTANGRPGLHHVMARAIKDIFCRYKTMKGFLVERKAGWDTHGLPVEIEVEKELGLEGRHKVEEYGIEKYNAACRRSVLRYTDVWNNLTRRMGYWVDLEHPYVTFQNEYIESVWWLLRQMFDKGLLYQGFKIQWYSPGSNTVLSSHEVSLGYKEVQDPSVYIGFRDLQQADTYYLAWTTTPWTRGLRGVAMLPKHRMGPDACVKVFWHA
jgi:isoleucyl-tRNA synthetase